MEIQRVHESLCCRVLNEHYKQQRLNEDLCSKNLLGDDFKRKLEVRKTGRQGFLVQRGKHDFSVLSSAFTFDSLSTIIQAPTFCVHYKCTLILLVC